MDSNNIPAFPILIRHTESDINGHYSGMTLLDYFAGKALQGIISAYAARYIGWNYAEAAEQAYRQAAATIEVRKIFNV